MNGKVIVFLLGAISISSHAEERMIGLKHVYNRDRCEVSTFFNDSLRISVEDKRILKFHGKMGCETRLNYENFNKSIKYCALAKIPSNGDCKLSIDGHDKNKTVEFTNYVHGDFNECLYTCLAR